jgi:chemotaxis protein CheD
MSLKADVSRFAKRVHVNQGEHYASVDTEVFLTAILGSCLSICRYDPTAKMGGMNRFFLPEKPDSVQDSHGRYGAYLAELLINDKMPLGAIKSRLEAKVFGGGKMFQGLCDVGATIAAFAKKFLMDEGATVLGGLTTPRTGLSQEIPFERAVAELPLAQMVDRFTDRLPNNPEAFAHRTVKLANPKIG